MDSSYTIAGFARRYGDYILCVLLIVVCSATITGLILRSSQSVADQNIWISHSHLVIAKVQNLAIRSERMTASARGYALTGETKFAKDYDLAKAEASDVIGELTDLFSDNPAQQGRVTGLQHYFILYSSRLDAGRVAKAGVASRRFEADAEAAKADVTRVISDILLEEQKIADGRISALEDYRSNRSRILSLVIFLMMFVVVFGVYFLRKQRRRDLAEQSLGEGGQVFPPRHRRRERRVFRMEFPGDKAFYSRQFWDMLYAPDQFSSTMQSFKELLHPDDRLRVLDYYRAVPERRNLGIYERLPHAPSDRQVDLDQRARQGDL